MDMKTNSYFVICFRWIENKSGFNLWQKYLKDRCIVKVSATDVQDVFAKVEANGFGTDNNSYVETMQSYINAYERNLKEGAQGYYKI